ncbi:phage tail tube protein, partial [Shigella flexneri]|uniref:phage tail tube protein n=1 Tax=Shigella flexneri TaxID=623 RepID=UPI001C0A798A
MTTPNPLAKTKGAGTTFWMYTGNGDAFANPLSDTDWLRLAMVKDLQPGEMTADAEDDTYLDDEDADWKTTTQGQKSVGDTSATLAWRPGDSGQKKLVQLFDSGEVCAFRIKYPNGTVDVVGQSVSDTINQFKRLKDDPVNAAKALDNALHFL